MIPDGSYGLCLLIILLPLIDCFLPFYRPENLRRSVDASIAALRGTKKIDLFEAVRVDPGFPIEDQIKTLVTLQREGKFDFIGVSECSAASVKRANAVSSILLPADPSDNN